MQWYKEGLEFSCTQCSACCRHNPGYVFLSEKDIETFCEHLKLSRKDFMTRYTRLVDFGFTKRISLTEKPNYDCVFWDQGCTVYPARPLQCRAFPFWSSVMADKETWDETAGNCPGMNQGQHHTVVTIENWLKQREAEPFVED